jgi:hypothetical protein
LRQALRDALAYFGIARLYSLDFEYQPFDGDNPRPICVCYREILFGENGKIWLWGAAPPCPFAMTEDEAFISYNFAAEASCFFALDWPRPLQVLDLYLEYLQVRNTWQEAINVGGKKKERKRLLEALRYFGLETRDIAIKEYWQKRAVRGGPWAPGEPEGMMTYCLDDADDVGRLFEPLANAAKLDDTDNLAYAFIRGRYAVAVASMVRTGIPVDPLLALARKHRVRIQNKLIERFDSETNVYDPGSFGADSSDGGEIHFNRARMTELIEINGLGEVWQRTDNGKMYAIDRKTLKRMVMTLPPDLKRIFAPIAELRGILGKVHPFDFEVGADWRARTSLFPLGTKTGRNNPSKYIFGADRGLRGFIKPGPGQAVAYLDWERQELAVAGYLSCDQALLCLAKSPDPYVYLGVKFNLIPKGGTKESHPDERQRCKGVMLGAVLYGMGPGRIASDLEIPVAWGHAIWRQIHEEYQGYWRWFEAQVDWAAARQPLRTPFGHALSFGPYEAVDFNARTAGNFGVQGVSAEIMRFSAIMGTEAGIAICGPVHDAFLIEAPIALIEAEIERMKALMAQAVELVLWPGCEIAVDCVIARYPDACTWQKSAVFDTIVSEIGEVEKMVTKA